MTDTIEKMRALLTMKNTFIKWLTADLEATRAKCEVLQAANEVLSAEVVKLRQWWRHQDNREVILDGLRVNKVRVTLDDVGEVIEHKPNL